MNPLFSESAAFALQRLTDLGWSPVAAQGMVGNLIQESGRNLNPTATHDGGTGFGIAGFRDPQPGRGRWTNLRNFSKQRGLDHRTLDAQLQFIDHELRTSERSVGDRLRQARDPAEAARAAISFFRPAGWTSRNPTGGHGWNNRLQNTMTLAGAPMPTNRIALDQVQQASFTPPMPPRRPGGLGGLGGAEPQASYASMSGSPGPSAQGGGDPSQTVPAALMALSGGGGDDRQQRAEAIAQTIPSLRQAGVQPRQPFSGRASGLDSFGMGGPQPFAPNQGPAALAPRGGGVAAMQANPMRPPEPNMTPRPATPPSFMPGGAQSQAQGVPSFAQGAPPPIQFDDAMPPVVGAVQGAGAGPPMPNVSAVAQAAQPQQRPEQPPMPPPQPNTGGQPMPQGIDPNQYAGGEWIPPDVGRALAAQQMGGQANMPAQGAQAAQGGGGGMPAPRGAPGGLGGLGGLRGPLHAAFLSMLTSNDRRTPFANMPAFMQQQMQMESQMQAQRQAEADRLHDQNLLFGGGEGGGQAGGQSAQAGPGGGGQQGDAPSSFSTGNKTVDRLLVQRQQATRALQMARTSEGQKAAEAEIKHLDALIDRYEKQSGSPTELARLRRERDALPPGHPDRAWYENRLQSLGQNPETNITIGGRSDERWGDPESGHAWLRDPETGEVVTEPDPSGRGVRPVQVPFAGSSADIARQQQEDERMAGARTQATTGATLLDEVTGAFGLRQALGWDDEKREYGKSKIAGPRTRKIIADNPTGLTALAYAGSPTADFIGTLASLQDTIGIERLLEIKRSGAGLGAVPAEQLRQLARALGALDAGLSDDLLRHNIDRVRTIYEDIVRQSLTDSNDETFRGVVLDVSPYVGQIIGGDEPSSADQGSSGFRIIGVE